MKQPLLSIAFLFFASVMIGQQKMTYPEHLKFSKLKPQATLELPEPLPGPVSLELHNPYPEIDLKAVSLETQIGETFYDLQTNSAIQNRLNLLANGDWAASWTGSQEMTGHADRGTAYVRRSGDTWGESPLIRLESARCGWPSLTADTQDNEVALSHTTATAPKYELVVMRREAGASEWTETNYPGNQPFGMLWPRTAASGDFLHVIALTTPIAFTGGLYEGLDGNLLYYRSSDGGVTFDIEELQLPGLDTMSYRTIAPDTYSIIADGANVAIAHFPAMGDMAIWKSTDNGDNWTKTIVYDFPLESYATDSGYTFEEIEDLYVDGVTPDSLAIESTDGAGSIVFDLTGKVHLAAGFTYLLDSDLTDGGINFFPGFGNIWYWNEDMGADGAVLLDDLSTTMLDKNQNDTLDLEATIPAYGNGLLSYISLGVNNSNDVIMSLSAIQEDLVDVSTSGFNFRHTLVTRSTDNGVTWEDPIDISESPYGISEIANLTEVVYGTLYPREVDGEMHMIYMRDFIPGLAVIGDMHNNLGSSIHYVSFPADLIASTRPTPIVREFDIYPNPTTSNFSVGFDLDKSASVQINLLNLLGQRVSSLYNGKLSAGHFEQNFSAEVGQGVYLLEIRADDNVSTKKLLITKK